MATTDLTAVISTHHRPGPLREAIAAIRDQEYVGVIETVVVFDKEDPDLSLQSDDPRRPVVVVANQRTPGLPGSRNTGVDVASAPVVGFCDDDDVWLPAKTRLQMELKERTGAPTVGCAIEIAAPDRTIARRCTGSAARIEDLIRTRIPEAYMSTVIVDRDAFLGPIGPVDEAIPGGYAEDYDWWVRAARYAPIPLVTEPMFRLRWQGQSYFRDKWKAMDDALGYMTDAHPEFSSDRKGLGRIEAQRAFARAAAGDRSGAWKLLAKAARHSPTEQRIPFAALVAAGVSGDKVMKLLNSVGRGI